MAANETLQNWRALLEKQPVNYVVEAKLYTDTWIIGEFPDLGPYTFINTIAASNKRTHQPRPAIVLRVAVHTMAKRPVLPMKDDFDHYHGGDHIDEITALASMVLGVRLKAGPIDREFMPGGSPYGRPIEYGLKSAPQFLPTSEGAQIPGTYTQRNLVDLKVLERFSRLRDAEANVLVKSARMYQQAVWIADADPALAWLLLVSAVETAANEWARNDGTPSERLESTIPKLYKLLQSSACSDLIDPVAALLVKYTGATRKFLDFLMRFNSGPPAVRPAGFLQFNYEQDLKQAMQTIYGHRSEALHSGTAFPFPMCQPPQLFTFEGVEDAAFQEIPSGLATQALGATWKKEQTPMLLHTFEYIARTALLNWWAEMSKAEEPTASAQELPGR